MINNKEHWNKYVKFLTKFISVLLTVLPFLSSAVPGKTVELTVTQCKQQEFNGFGTSTCWWAQNIDDEDVRQKLAKELFSSDGLGINILRYNVGGGTNPEHDRIAYEWRKTESFYYYNEATGKYEYDFSRDANAQAFLKQALHQENSTVDTVILFANSPHYSMTISGESGGNTVAGETNLAPEHYGDFVDYFLTITEHFISEGIPVKYISPLNEPQWDWSGEWSGQEGCHYEVQQVLELLALFSKGIDERGLDVKISAPESGEVSELTTEYFNTIASDKEAYKNVASLAYHSYWSDFNLYGKQCLGDLISGEKFKGYSVDMTEWCELPCSNDVDATYAAVLMARTMANDINYSKVNSWSSWVAVNGVGRKDGKLYSDGLFWTEDDFSEYDKTIRYYAMGHFSKFVPAGSQVLTSKCDTASLAYILHTNWNTDPEYMELNFCAFKTPQGKTVVVIVNQETDRTVKLSLPLTVAKSMSVYTTDDEHRLDETYRGFVKRSIKVSANSITTVVID